jgi:hypothetical protein
MERPHPTQVTAKSRSFPSPLYNELLLYLHLFPPTTLLSQIQSLMAHYIHPLRFHLHTSFILLLHCLSYSSPSSYSNTSIHLLCLHFVILSTTLSSCDQYEWIQSGIKYRSRGAPQVRTFLHLVKARQSQDLGANRLQNKTAIQMLFFSGMIFLLSVRSQYFLLLLLQSYPFNLMKRMNTTAVPATKTCRRCSGTLLILAEIQKTDLAWKGEDFVEIKGSLPPSPHSPVYIRRIREDMPYLNTYREDEQHIPFCSHTLPYLLLYP